MKDLAQFMVSALVDVPENVVISQTEGENVTVIEIQVDPIDTGKIIGKKGRIANALRTILKSAGAKQRKRLSVEILTQDKEGVERNGR